MTRYQMYLEQLKENFTKLAKLEFLNPDGSVAFALDNREDGRSKAFLQEGSISANLQNGRRRQASVSLTNLNGDYDFAVNRIWMGQSIRLSEGLLLPDGSEYYIPQGVFLIENPEEALAPNKKQSNFQLVDKWAALDGSLGGNLEGAYKVAAGTNIFEAMATVLTLDKYDYSNNGSSPIDPVTPLFTDWYKGKTQILSDGSSVNLTDAPYDFLAADTGTLGDVLLGLAEMLAAWIGYNETGRLVVDPSQDDILDITKPVLWQYSMREKQFLSMRANPKPAEVYNDVIVVGATSDDSRTARGRAQNRDPASDTCISRIGMKTKRLQMSNYYADEICQSYAEWKLKRYATMSKTVSISSTQMFHIKENKTITVERTDKPGNPVERYLIQSFTRPIGQKGAMTINAVSVNDFPIATPVVESDKYMVIGETLFVPEGVNADVAGTQLNIPGSVSGEELVLSNP